MTLKQIRDDLRFEREIALEFARKHRAEARAAGMDWIHGLKTGWAGGERFFADRLRKLIAKLDAAIAATCTHDWDGPSVVERDGAEELLVRKCLDCGAEKEEWRFVEVHREPPGGDECREWANRHVEADERYQADKEAGRV